MIIFRQNENTITGQVDGHPFLMPRTDKTLSKLLKLQAENGTKEEVYQLVADSRKETIAGKNKFLVYNPVTEKYYLHYKKKISKYPIPDSLANYIEESYDKNVDYMPVIKGWARLLANPRLDREMIEFFDKYISSEYVDEEQLRVLMEEEGYSYEEAKKMATYPDIAFTKEGMLATYKVAEMVTWEYTMEEQEDGSWEKIKNPKYKYVPPVLDDVTGDIVKEGYTELPEFKEDILFTPAIYKHGDKFYSGENLGYVYEVGQIQKLPEKAKRNLRNTFGGGGLSMCSFN